MNKGLAEALEILGEIERDDASQEARGRRAHARVLTMMELVQETSRTRREQRIANLLKLAELDKKGSSRALKEARRLLAEDDGGAAAVERRLDVA